jgi:hypothetical protein
MKVLVFRASWPNPSLHLRVTACGCHTQVSSNVELLQMADLNLISLLVMVGALMAAVMGSVGSEGQVFCYHIQLRLSPKLSTHHLL